MILYNTRFIPTVNGYLHLGHLYNCLVNQAEAQRSGGYFVIRFDDTQRAWNFKYTASELDNFKFTMKIDLQHFGIAPDRWSSQSDMMKQTVDLAGLLHYDIPPDTYLDLETVEVIGHPESFYPANERLTAEHVLMDCIEGINLIVRGFDLITEAAAYLILAHRLGLPRTRHVYIPRLAFPGDVVSKTAGNFKLKEYRSAGDDPEEIIRNLALDCLIYPFGPWLLDNLQPHPVLGEWAKALLSGGIA
jgi:glutamyl/glutaminyl-tRNA synthetase